MPLPVIPGVARASIGGLVDGGGRWNNTTHWRRADLAVPSGVEIAALAVIIEAFYAAVILPLCAVPTTADSLDITPLDGTSGAFHTTPALAGTNVGGSMPAEVSAVMTIRTGVRGRRARGRIYLPPFGVGEANADGTIGATVSTAVVTAAAAAATAAGVAGWQWGVASYGRSFNRVPGFTDHRVALSTWDPFFTEATTFTMDNAFDVIRGRKS